MGDELTADDFRHLHIVVVPVLATENIAAAHLHPQYKTTIKGPLLSKEDIFVLDAISSPSTYPCCQWVGQCSGSVSDS